MRILFVADDLYPGYGGQARSTMGHVNALAKRGHELSVVAGRMRGETQPPEGVRLTRLPAWLVPGTQTLLALPLLARINAALAGSDVVHINLPTPLAAVTTLLARRAAVPVVMGVHTQLETSELHAGRAAGLVRWALQGWYSRLFGAADLLIAPTPFAAAVARGFASAPVEVVSNGVDLTHYPEPAFASASGARRLVYVGRLSPEKRPLDLLALMAELGPGFELTIAGAGPLAGEMAREVARLRLGERVKLLGFVSEAEKRALLAASELFVILSPAELQSIATLEAMASGCAVAAAGHASSAVPSLVRESRGGVVLPATGAAAQAAGVTELLGDPARLLSARRNARAYALSHDLRRVAARLEELYARVAVKSGGA